MNVLDFLKKPNASELVSGTKDRVNLHDRFRSAIEAAHPGMIKQLDLRRSRRPLLGRRKHRSGILLLMPRAEDSSSLSEFHNS